MMAGQSVRVTLTSVVMLVCLMSLVSEVRGNGMDQHGGVPMGLKNPCDDAETDIEIDWNPRSSEEYTCYGETITQNKWEKPTLSCERQTKMGIHVCYSTTINYTDVPPTSGSHRPNWAKYGEYTYVPPQRWLHNLEHGAIVMLYHPCANPSQVNLLRNILTHCLRKHIITPSKLLARDTPFALLSWGCKLIMSDVDVTEARSFIETHAKKDGPEGELSKDGRYNQSLVVPAQEVSDISDSIICPPRLQQWQESLPPQSRLDTAGGDYTGYQVNQLPGDDRPSLSVLSSILQQSQTRRRQLDQQTAFLRRDIQRLNQSFRQLMPQ